MQYFKHSELANQYHVSLKTVHNWIDAAKQAKLELELFDKNGRKYVANKSSNIVVLKRLADQGKKYRNDRFSKIARPKPELYETFSRRQILDIISNISIHREIPSQYNYVDGGAHNWDAWVKKLATESGPNNLNNTIELMRLNRDSIDHLLKDCKKVNIIDLGCGNGYPVKELLQHLIDLGIMHRYIAVDISQTMLDIAEANIREWFGEKIQFEGYVRDFTYERFDDLVVDDMLSNDADSTVNFVLLLGATPMNFRSFAEVLRTINGSMGEGDLLAYTGKPDTESARRYFDFNTQQKTVAVPPIARYVLDMLNIDESLYVLETGYDEQLRMRFGRVRLNTAVRIKFEFENSERNVDLEKGDTILLLRIKHLTALEIIAEFEKAGFVLLQSNMPKDRERLLTLLGVDNDSAK